MPLPSFGDRLGNDALVVDARVATLALILVGAALIPPVRASAKASIATNSGEQVLAGLERVEAQHDLRVHRAAEELALEDELLPHQRREPVRGPRQRRAGRLVAARKREYGG
jgi:hypothetical protein